MGKKLYVGNLAYSVGDSDLQQMFEPHGTVQSAQVIMDRDTGRSKGFGFVEMGSDQEAQAAIAALNGKEVDGRALTVNEARPKTEGGGGGGGGYGGGGRGGRGGGGGGGGGGYGGGGGGGPAAADDAINSVEITPPFKDAHGGVFTWSFPRSRRWGRGVAPERQGANMGSTVIAPPCATCKAGFSFRSRAERLISAPPSTRPRSLHHFV